MLHWHVHYRNCNFWNVKYVYLFNIDFNTFENQQSFKMKALRVFFALAAVLFITSACNRVKCPTDTFSKAEIENQNQKLEEANH